MIFYKGVLIRDLTNSYTPGTVTSDINEALVWKERIDSKKNRGASKHIRHGDSVIIEFQYTDELLDSSYFQKEGVREHDRLNCWTSDAKVKAQINSVIDSYRILSSNEICDLIGK